jgi:hypothetical protein
MRRIALLALAMTAGLAPAAEPAANPSMNLVAPPSFAAPTTVSSEPLVIDANTAAGGERGLLESDRCFPRFIGPMSNPVLAKDPRALTEVQMLFVNNGFPNSNAVLGGGDAQVYGAQIRVALTDRLSFIADKDGIASINSRNLPARSGWLDVAAGFKYALVRDVEDQFLVTTGFQYELPSGESKVFQNQGSGVMTIFGIVGKEFNECWHVLFNGGYQFGLDSAFNSSFFYAQLHVDRQLFGWLSPLAECNWLRYTSGGHWGIPHALGEGDGLINFGTAGVGGDNIVTFAVGAKAQLGPHIDLGAAYEFPVGHRDILQDRVIVQLILRY